MKRKTAEQLHSNVPPDWYFKSIRENFLQRYWHRRRFIEIKKIAESVKNGKVLDIGSADGVFTRELLNATKADQIIGIDVLESSVEWANKHWKRNKNMKFMVADAHELPFKDNEFDAVFALEVLEHVYNPDKVLKEIRRVLKKGGYTVFLVPTDVIWFKFLWDHFWTKTRGKVWNDTHLQSYTNNEIIKVTEKVGLKVEKSKKFIFGMLQAIKARKV